MVAGEQLQQAIDSSPFVSMSDTRCKEYKEYNLQCGYMAADFYSIIGNRANNHSPGVKIISRKLHKYKLVITD